MVIIMSTKKLTLTALLTAVALMIFILEAQLPPILPIPGIKPGLANIITLLALVWLGKKEALLTLILRIVLGCIFTGNLVSLMFSLAGGIAAYIFTAVMLNISNNITVSSIVGALGHNIGQIFTAIFLTNTPQIIHYLPALAISGIVTGLFTGIISQLIIKRFGDLKCD